MGLDPFSFAAPARIKILCVPTGRIRQSRFNSFVERLRNDSVVRLGDVSPSSKPNKTFFSPLAFPDGLIVYDLLTTEPPPSHAALAPFELYRQPLLIVGVLDGHEESKNKEQGRNSAIEEDETSAFKSFPDEIEKLRKCFPDALVHNLLVFDRDHDDMDSWDGVFYVPNPRKSRTTTIKTLMCDLTSAILAEMTELAKSVQNAPAIRTPTVATEHNGSNGVLSAIPNHLISSARSGSALDRPRSFSPAGDDSRWQNRMSLPINLASNKRSRSATPDSRAGSPPSDSQTPPTTFDEISRVPEGSSSRKQSNDRSRTESQDRSVPKFESSNLAEREKIKHKGRVGVIIGSMYLLAGRWPDAAREFVQSTHAARANSDYVWQAKALDFLLVCLLMCAWAGMDFHIPDVLRPISERPASSSSKNRNSGTTPELITSRNVDPDKKLSNKQLLADVIPDVLINVLNLFIRAWTFTEDRIPPISYSQSAIRFAKLLTLIHKDNGHLSDSVLSHVALGQLVSNTNEPQEEPRKFISALEISGVLLRAYPVSSVEEAMPVNDQITTLASIVSVLSDLGFHRKKALVLKELMSLLLPELVQARKHGAAEMGVHPAASLTSINVTSSNAVEDSSFFHQEESGQIMERFLAYVSESFGINFTESKNLDRDRDNLSKPRPSDAKKPQISSWSAYQAIRQNVANRCGSLDLKINVLRTCIHVCEALPNLAGALQYSAELLRISGSGIAPGPESSEGSPCLPIEEQLRLANNISRTLSAAKYIGLKDPEAEYWDEFLVRGIEIIESGPSNALIPHAKSELEIAETIEVKKEKNPFIYNPFSKASSKKESAPLLMASEEASFRVTLQNLYDLDLYIEEIRLEAPNPGFKSSPQSTMIGPYRTQVLILTGSTQATGPLVLTGCSARIRGCRKRSFAIFKEPWEFKPKLKGREMRALNSSSLARKRDSGVSDGSIEEVGDGPKASSLLLNVVKAQPTINLLSMSLPQSTLMLLEGERRKFSIIIENSSASSAADLILLSFSDSTTSQLQSNLSSKQISEAEMYEIELAAATKPSFRWIREDKLAFSDKTGVCVEPGQELQLEIEVFGKPGLSYGTVQIDYAHLGVPRNQIQETFYTRQLSIPLAITINASIDLVKTDIISFPTDLGNHVHDSASPFLSSRQDNRALEFPADTAKSKLPTNAYFSERPATPHVLLLLDFRNSWPKTLLLHLNVSKQSQASNETGQSSTAITHSISPGTVARIPIPFPKMYLPFAKAHSPIPSFNPATARQFIVSKTVSTPFEEMALREAFWFREELLKHLHVYWTEEGTGRSGQVEMRALRLSGRMVTSLNLNDINIEMGVTLGKVPTTENDKETELEDDGESKSATSMREVTQIGCHSFNVPTSTFLTLKSTLLNRSDIPIKAILRLQPTLAGQPHNVALDLGKKLLVNGLLQRNMPILKPSEKIEVETEFIVLCSGVYEWTACVEEVRQDVRTQAAAEEHVNRPRAKTGAMDLTGALGRRIWYAESSCTIFGRRGDTGQ